MRLMSTTNIRLVKYVFLDVVAYTKRTIELQCDITKALNGIVKSTINRYEIGDDSVIYIPTGDGICIALVDVTLPYDIHVKVALEILRKIWVYNKPQGNNMRKFEVRIGINQCDDNLLEDINGRRNVAGAGINNARRIMDLADGNQILVSRSVYDTLHQRKQYSGAFSNRFAKTVKHGVILEVYQLIRANVAGLNVNPPSSFVITPTPEPKLTKLAAYYLAHSIKNEEFILRKLREREYNHNLLKLLIWHLAKESERLSDKKVFTIQDYSYMPKTGYSNIEGHFEWFENNVPSDIAINLVWVILDNAMYPLQAYDYFERNTIYSVVNSSGKEKLRRDWPEIWNEFGLEELSG
jgi:hypothetical protein